MAKVGYIYKTPGDEGLNADIEWMKQFGCTMVAEEAAGDERKRPKWAQLLEALESGDEIVVSKFSNAVRGIRSLSAFLDLCRKKSVRVVSIHDKLDTASELFPETTAADVLSMFGALPGQAMALRKAEEHVADMKRKLGKRTKKKFSETRQEREQNIVEMYKKGTDIDRIWLASGFRSRSSVFRVLNKHGVELNRGYTRGPMGKRKPKSEE